MKLNNKKRKIIITSLIIGIVISFSFFVIGYKNFLNPNLGYFEIENINEEKDKLCISVSPSNYASSYKVIGYDANGKAVYEAKSDSNVISLDNLYMNYEETISFQVKAFNKNGKSLDSNNFYEYISKDLSFDNNLEHYSVKDKDYIVTLNGEFQDEEYYLEIHYEGLFLKTILVESNQVVINKDILNELSGKVVLKLKKGERIVNQFNLYSNVPIVGNFEITNIE